MITLNIKKTRISVSELEPIIEGNINSIGISFIFSSEWTDLARVAVFSNGTTKVSVFLDSNTCVIPWEVLTSPGHLFVSLRGMGDDGNYVICTAEVSLGMVKHTAASEHVAEAEEATPEVIDALFASVERSKGMSAYEVARESGFEGTEAQWLASLKGADGEDGINGTNGADGNNGADGLDGHTPEKGVDYYTAEDKLGIISDVLASLPVWEGGSF